MPMQKAQRQMPANAGREAVGQGEAMPDAFSDEAFCPRHATGGTGSALLQAALTTENLRRAFKRVRANKGAAGVDGLDIDQTSRLLATEWPHIRERLLAGTYRPSPVRRVTIPKPDGGERELGIPTVTDRLIQQALLQVLQPILDPTFSEHSYGFRPGRRAQDAVLAAQAYVQSGLRIVVDVDLSKFFDRVQPRHPDRPPEETRERRWSHPAGTRLPERGHHGWWCGGRAGRRNAARRTALAAVGQCAS